MGMNSGRPFPKSKLLGGGEGRRACTRKHLEQVGRGLGGNKRHRKGFPGPFCLTECALQTLREKDSLHSNVSPLSTEKLNSVPQEDASAWTL